jgi:hypothetical protein
LVSNGVRPFDCPALQVASALDQYRSLALRLLSAMSRTPLSHSSWSRIMSEANWMMQELHPAAFHDDNDTLSSLYPQWRARGGTTAEMLTVIWNWRNLATASLTLRPHMTACREGHEFIDNSTACPGTMCQGLDVSHPQSMPMIRTALL